MKNFVTFFPDVFFTEKLFGAGVGPEDIQLPVHHAHGVADAAQHGVKGPFTLTQGFIAPASLQQSDGQGQSQTGKAGRQDQSDE